jgi:hypothetical protein
MATIWVLLPFCVIVALAYALLRWQYHFSKESLDLVLPPLFCSHCGATWRGADNECWNCHRAAIASGPMTTKQPNDWNNNVNTSVVLKVSVLRSNKILADGAETLLPDLDILLESTKAQNGIIWYYRELVQNEVPDAAMEVLEMIAKRELPIRLFAKPDFSDVV